MRSKNIFRQGRTTTLKLTKSTTRASRITERATGWTDDLSVDLRIR
jgi:hypothetical protein